ncbi:Low density lipoprotein receptor adapter protein 1 [Bienertia sinuspersici]
MAHAETYTTSAVLKVAYMIWNVCQQLKNLKLRANHFRARMFYAVVVVDTVPKY